jgi:hypothetical protein
MIPFPFEIVIAAIGAVPVIVGSVLAYRVSMYKQKLEHENKSMKKEMDLVSTSLSSFGGILTEFAKVEAEIHELCRETGITRVMLLCAWNGVYSPKWTTAVWQYRKDFAEDGSINRPIGYVHVGLDADYVERLVSIKRKGSMVFRTEDAPDSLIKKIYEVEGVTESLWVFLSSAGTPDGMGRLVTYMSFSTQGGEVDRTAMLKCELLAARLAPLTGCTDHEQ